MQRAKIVSLAQKEQIAPYNWPVQPTPDALNVWHATRKELGWEK